MPHRRDPDFARGSIAVAAPAPRQSGWPQPADPAVPRKALLASCTFPRASRLVLSLVAAPLRTPARGLILFVARQRDYSRSHTCTQNPPCLCGAPSISHSLFSAAAQSSGAAGTIDGLVTDPAGAVIPGAKVELNNPLTRLQARRRHRRFRRIPLPQHPAKPLPGCSLRRPGSR